MLTITIPSDELYDEANNEFIIRPEVTLHMEHSLVSLSKWEEKFHKAYSTDEQKTSDEYFAYIKCMCLDTDVDESVFERLTSDNIKAINDYISDEHTATKVFDLKKSKTTASHQKYTSEIIYYQMIVRQIPLELEHWNLNRLFTFIRVYDIEQAKQSGSHGKMTPSEYRSWQRSQNEARRRKLHTRG